VAAEVTAQQRRWFRAIGLSVIALAAALMLVYLLSQPYGPGMLGDLEIYKGAISYALSGQPLYDWVYLHPTVHGLGFTYPPFAALVLAWLVPLDLGAAKAIWVLLTFAVLVACVLLVVRTGLAVRRPDGVVPLVEQVTWTAALMIAVIFTYPFLHDMIVGQVSLFVIALALFDHQLPRKWQGVLVGVAGAIKLTPLVFIPYFLITKQWRQAVIATAAFIGASLVAFAVLPQASIAYWTDKLWQTGRVGRTESTVSKSLLSMLTRLMGDATTTKVAWLVLAAAVTALALWQASRSYRQSDYLGAALVVGSLSVAVSPISWPHHQLWLVLVACWWALQPGRWPKVLAAVLFAIFWCYPAFDDYQTVSGWLAVAVELPVIAVLLVLGLGSQPRWGRVRVIDDRS
jgi:alpha-1,2-mannosyltransferase